MGNKYLNKLTVALLNPATKVDNNKQIQEILRTYHDDPIQGGHYGINKTLNKIKRHFFWPNMTKTVTKYVKSCEKCQKSKTIKHTKIPLQITDTPHKVFENVLVDTIGPLPKTENGNEYAITLICDLTKYLVSIPVPNKSANTTAKAIFESFVLQYVPMKNLITDMGTEYKNALINDLCKYMKTKHVTSTAHHHETMGTVE